MCRWPRAAAPPPMSDDLARWLGEGQWAALVSLSQQLPAFSGLAKDLEKSGDEWEKWAAGEAAEHAPLPGGSWWGCWWGWVGACRSSGLQSRGAGA